MMSPRITKIVAILLAIIAGMTAILGYEAVFERQHIPPAYSSSTLDF